MTGREAAFRVLGDYRRKKTRPELSFSILCEKTEIPEREAALAMNIVSGVMQNMAYCDYIASHYSLSKLKNLEPRLLDILRVSIYQIVFLTKIPHSAAVNEGVALAKKYSNPRAPSFINAVLRKVAENAANKSLPEVTGENEYQRLSIKYSHPEWLVREFCRLPDIVSAEALLQINNNTNTPVTAQVNSLQADIGEVISALIMDGVEARRHIWLDDCIEMFSPGKIERLAVFREGLIYIQDAAARLAVVAADPKPGGFVIDACAAPGGKSFASAIMMGNTGRIEAWDINAGKLNMIRDGSARLGIDIIDIYEKDAAAKDDAYLKEADVVLADVPCSGFGAIRKKPDIRYRPQQDVIGLTGIQKEILFSLSSYVKPGGTLLYSTCTILREENEYVIESFLRKCPEFTTAGFSLPGIGHIPGGMITLFPHIHGTDGFFICKLVRSR